MTPHYAFVYPAPGVYNDITQLTQVSAEKQVYEFDFQLLPISPTLSCLQLFF